MTLAPLFFIALRPAHAPEVKLRTAPFAAHYCDLRYYALDPEGRPAGYQAGTEALRAIDRGMPAADRRVKDLYWKLVDSVVLQCAAPDDLLDSRYQGRKVGGSLDLGETLAAVAQAMRDTQAAAQTQWKADQARLTKAQDAWMAARPKLDAAYAFLESKLGVTKPPASVDVLLVPRLEGAGGITLRTPGQPLVVVGCNRFEGADFVEVVVHETLHAYDTATTVGLFRQVREEMRSAQVPQPRAEQVVHLLVFLHAAEAVRRAIDPGHRDVGETFGIYAKGLERDRKAVAPALAAYWSGKTDLATCAKQIAAACK
ncbi:MAG: hypothetical protein KF857_10555 [Fimbriimonadaceae bacterium]|nr:hypothetical protein [Fimbriimonadaceae bacterium]